MSSTPFTVLSPVQLPTEAHADLEGTSWSQTTHAIDSSAGPCKLFWKQHAVELSEKRHVWSESFWKQGQPRIQRAECELGSDACEEDEHEFIRTRDAADPSNTGLNDVEDAVADPGPLELQKVFAAPVEHIRESWNQVSELSRLQGETTRRRVLGAPMFMSLAFMFRCPTKEGCSVSSKALTQQLDTSVKP